MANHNTFVSEGLGGNLVSSVGWRFAKVVLLVLVSVDGLLAFKHVTEINKGNFEKFLKDKLFVLTYVDSTGCSRCRNFYPYFVAASQSFPKDEDIFFTRTYDKQLIQDWGIIELPALVYHKKGVDRSDVYGKRATLSVDITVDDILEGIERTLHGDFDHVKKKYVVAVDSDSYDEIVTTPTQSVLLLMHDEASKKKFLPEMEKAAYVFRKDDGILFASLDLDKHSKLRDDRFQTRDSPAVMWLEEGGKKTPKRFGGMIVKELLVTFVNEKTGLNRLNTGAMLNEAGRIPAADALLEEHADVIHNVHKEDLGHLYHMVKEIKTGVSRHHIVMLDYYMTIIDEIGKAGSATSVIEDMILNLEAQIYEEDHGTKTKELQKRQMNVLQYFKEVVKRFSSGQWQKPEGSKVTLEPVHMHTEL